MDMNKLGQQLDRRLDKIESSIAADSGRGPIQKYSKYFYTDEIPYEDSVIEARVILARKRLEGLYKGVYLDTLRGPWVLFKVIDIIEGDPRGLICPGTTVLAKWDNQRRVYSKYIEKEDPNEFDPEIQAISSIVGLSAYEVATANLK